MQVKFSVFVGTVKIYNTAYTFIVPEGSDPLPFLTSLGNTLTVDSFCMVMLDFMQGL